MIIVKFTFDFYPLEPKNWKFLNDWCSQLLVFGLRQLLFKSVIDPGSTVKTICSLYRIIPSLYVPSPSTLDAIKFIGVIRNQAHDLSVINQPYLSQNHHNRLS